MEKLQNLKPSLPGIPPNKSCKKNNEKVLYTVPKFNLDCLKLETNNAETNSAETNNAETNSAETNSAETNSAETNSAETNNAETNSAETNNAENKKIITKTTIQRLVKDIRDLLKSPLNEHGIYYSHDEENILKGYALIIGPSETPYFGGFYFFEFNFPEDYPFSPPSVIFLTNGDDIRFNPNLYKCGRVCVSILNTWSGDQWSSCQSITTVLLSLCSLFCKNPLLNEPGLNPSNIDLHKYNKIIEFKNIDIAIIKIIKKDKNVYYNNFDVLFPFVIEHFNKNKKDILSFLEDKNNKKKSEKIITNIYSMNVTINYEKLLKEYLSNYDIFENENSKNLKNNL